jgi:signal peptidase I
VRLNLSDEPITAELLDEALRRTGGAVIAVNGTSMHPTLQMGWRVYLKPATGDDLKIGEIAVFRGDRYLTVHRLVWKEADAGGARLVFRGDYNRMRERVPPGAVLARVVAVEIPGAKKGLERVVALEADVLTLFYRLAFTIHSLARPVLPRPVPPGAPIALPGRIGRALFAGVERLLSVFLPGRR